MKKDKPNPGRKVKSVSTGKNKKPVGANGPRDGSGRGSKPFPERAVPGVIRASSGSPDGVLRELFLFADDGRCLFDESRPCRLLNLKRCLRHERDHVNEGVGVAAEDLRIRLAEMTADDMRKVSRCLELKEWRAVNRFCGKCGAAMKPHPDPRESAFRCPECGYLAYPKISPAVIVLVTKGDSILLQRNSHYKSACWSLVAGYVDPGENFEDAVARECMEEASITVKNIRYFKSQTWPFPSNVMVGFRAEWAGGELKADGREVLQSGWFERGALPEIPLKGSIARWLIDEWESSGQ